VDEGLQDRLEALNTPGGKQHWRFLSKPPVECTALEQVLC